MDKAKKVLKSDLFDFTQFENEIEKNCALLKNGSKLLAEFVSYAKEYDEWFSKNNKISLEKAGPIDKLLFWVFWIY